VTERLYTDLAPFYDVLYQIRDAKGQVEFVLDQFERHARRRTGTALVLGCGTGVHGQHLVDAGFDLVGIDKYDQMLDVARDRVDGTFRQGTLPDVELDGTFDLVFLPGTVVNYLSPEELERTFDLVSAHLSDEGLLAFDFGALFDVKGGPPPFFHAGSDGDIHAAQLVQLRRLDERTTRWNAVVFLDTPDRGEFFIDRHEVVVYDREQLRELLVNRGFTVEVHEDGYGTGDYFDYTIETVVAR
jgi:hypothetical protein